MWDFSLTEDGEGGRLLSFLVDNKTINFKIHKSESGTPIGATRLPDSESEDFGLGGDARKGRAQIHKATPSKIVGTFQTGKNNMTFEFDKSPDSEHLWSLVPRKNPEANVSQFVKAILEKKIAAEDKGAGLWDKIKKTRVPLPSIDTITYPLTGDAPGGIAVSAGLGAGAMALKNMYDRVSGNEHNSLLTDMLLGAGGGAAASGLFRWLGTPEGKPREDRDLYRNNMNPGQRMLFPQKFYTDKSYWDVLDSIAASKRLSPPGMTFKDLIRNKDLELSRQFFKDNQDKFNQIVKAQKGASQDDDTTKTAFMSGNQEVDMIALQSILGADPTITPAERRALAAQARSAMSASGSTYVSINSVKAGGLGMLAGYIMSKMMGFGGLGTLASVAIGGAVGSSFGGKSGPMWNSRGYYEY